MTCILGVEYNNKVYIGGDSSAFDQQDILTISHKKVFKNGYLLIGYSSSFRIGQLLEYKLKCPRRRQALTDMQFVINHIVPVIKSCLDENDINEYGVFLMGYNSRLYLIQEDFSVIETSNGVASCGCGEAYALGAYAGLIHGRKKYDVKTAIIDALRITARYCSGVKEPFYVYSI